MNIAVSASVLAADLSELSAEIARMSAAGADMIHYDVMDGVFVDNISMGIPVLESLRKHTDMFLDVHLMIQNPLKYAKTFKEAGADMITFHIEAQSDINETIDAIHALGIKAGISVKPNTPAEAVFPYIGKVENILVMTVEPGFGGQGFIEDCVPKIKAIRGKMNEIGASGCYLQVDGGINEKTAPVVKANGADNLVSGSYLFRAKSPADAVKTLKQGI